MRKKRLILPLIAVMSFASGLTAFASPKTMSDGGTFDAAYYAQMYPDVTAVYGTDENVLYQHYLLYGKAEGRQAFAAEAVQPAVTVPNSPYLASLTSPLPQFSAEVRNKNNQLVPVVMEPTDGRYLMYTDDETREYFGVDGRRKDYSNDEIYLAARDYIIEALNADVSKELVEIMIPITFLPKNSQEERYLSNLAGNLEIDFHKSPVCRDLTLFMGTNPADGRWHLGETEPYELIIFCTVSYGMKPQEVYNNTYNG